MSPLIIETLLFHHYSPEDVDKSNSHTPAYRQAVEWLRARHLMKSDTPELTDRGTKLVEMLCDTPLPVSTWSDPRE